MDLLFTEEQNILRDTVRNLCENTCTIDTVREMENDPVGVPTAFWEQLKDMGILAVMLPEEYGGLGLSMIDAVLVYEELGRVLAPGPYFVSTVMAVGAINKSGSDAQKADLLPALGTGELIITPAWLEPDNGYGAAGVQVRSKAAGEGYVINGEKRHVFYAKAAQKLLVLARTGDAEDAVDLFLVDTDAAGVELEQQLSMASDTQYKVTFNDVKVGAADRIGAEGTGWQTWDAVMHDGIILCAARAVGGAQQALDITVQYSKEREQFDKPIGSFQSLAHYMADAATAVAGARTIVWEAAWSHAEGRSIARLAPMAKLFACNMFRDTTAKCEQIHGGYGFTLEYDIQLFYRRAKQLQLNWWDSRYLEDLVAVQVLDTDQPTVEDSFTL